jgi:mono/diheme cytochrome c family protein
MATSRSLLMAAALALAFAAQAGEEKVRIKEDTGADKVRQNCNICHSLDYIRLNSPFLDEKGWEAAVNKMIKGYGAQIPPGDVKPMAEYLGRNYGKR